MSKPHKHAELIKAWADGADIEGWSPVHKNWVVCRGPNWNSPTAEFRIKSEKVVRWQWISVYKGEPPQISRNFYTESEAMDAYKPGVSIVAKADWTRTEFDQ